MGTPLERGTALREVNVRIFMLCELEIWEQEPPCHIFLGNFFILYDMGTILGSYMDKDLV